MIKLRIPARLPCRTLLAAAARAACELARGRGVKLSERFVHELVSAVGEAFNNIVLHAYQGRGGVVEIVFELEDDALSVTLTDEGKRFDLDAVPFPDLEALPESGLGVYIMLSCVDQVDYAPGSPNRLTLRKQLPSTQLAKKRVP